MKLSFFTFALLVSLITGAFARDVRQQARIDFLLHEVETAQGVTFIRNGAEHDPVSAAQHLRMKLNYAGARVQTAEEFIKACASESSLTRQKYKVRLADGKTIEARDYFNDKLRQFDRDKH